MESTRQKKFARAMQRELSELLRLELERELGVMITVSHVSATADLQIARIYITVMPEARTGYVLNILQEINPQLRHKLAKSIRHVVKQVPELQFFEDETGKTAERIDELLDNMTYTTPEGEEPLEGYSE